MKIIAIGEDYVCPECGKMTSRFCTKLQCDCWKRSTTLISLGGIVHIAQEVPPAGQKSDDPLSKEEGTHA